ASSAADDAKMLVQAIPQLATRMTIDEIYTDGGYNSQSVDKLLPWYRIEQYQTAIRGPSIREGYLGVSDFVFQRNKQGKPQQVTCPGGQQVSVGSTYTDDRFRAVFDATICGGCSWLQQCPTIPQKRKAHLRHLRFEQEQVNIAHRYANQRKLKLQPHNLRAAIEGTIRLLKHPFKNGKLPVRGHPRMSMMMVASAAMTNIRRLWQATLNTKPAYAGASAMDTPIQPVLYAFANQLSVIPDFLERLFSGRS
ncbi:MAG: transposase, partial [Chloroflexota bacterium]